MTAQTTTQRTAKHRLAVKEKLQRYERALREIATGYYGATAHIIAESALAADRFELENGA